MASQSDVPHLCKICNKKSEVAPVYYCPNKHAHCVECFRELRRRYSDDEDSGCCIVCNCTSGDAPSKRPVICQHKGCEKSVAITSLLSHFKHDHAAVPCFSVNKGHELKLPFDAARIVHSRTQCLAVVTLYEDTFIDVSASKSVASVRSACSRLNTRVPVNTFWLMMSGSKDPRKCSSYAVFWLYSNSEDRFWCTLEISSQNESINVSCFCNSVRLEDGHRADDVLASLNCLFVSYGAFVGLLGEGDKINFRVTVH